MNSDDGVRQKTGSTHGMTEDNIKLGTELCNYIRAHAPRFKHIARHGDRFTIKDIESMDKREFIGLTQRLVQKGLLRRVSEKDLGRGNYINVYEWSKGAREKVLEYTDLEDTLPCGHRPHINNKGDGSYGCNHCSVERNYSKETVLNAL